MIPTVPTRPAGISRRVSFTITALLLGACAVDAETTLARSARERQHSAAEARRDELRSELARFECECRDTQRAIAVVKGETVRRAAELRVALAELEQQIARLTRAEQDLQSARARADAVERELPPSPAAAAPR